MKPKTQTSSGFQTMCSIIVISPLGCLLQRRSMASPTLMSSVPGLFCSAYRSEIRDSKFVLRLVLGSQLRSALSSVEWERSKALHNHEGRRMGESEVRSAMAAVFCAGISTPLCEFSWLCLLWSATVQAKPAIVRTIVRYCRMCEHSSLLSLFPSVKRPHPPSP